MDLHYGDAHPDPEEAAAIDAAAPPGTPPGRRDLLLPVLHAVADRVGWISPGALAGIARRLEVAPAEVYATATFYARFALEPRLRRVRYVCEDLACTLARARPGGRGADGGGPPEAVVPWPCLGRCEVAPAELVLDGGRAIGPPRPAAAAVPRAGDPGQVLLSRVGVVPPTDLDGYRALGGYAALRRALELGPAGTIEEITASGLTGRGGAAFPAGRKWAAVATNPRRPHHLVCNADESEPGTFKDRVLLEGDPFAIIEAMTVAAYATGCERGVVYLRFEYPEAARVLQEALGVARHRGYLGPDVMGSGFAFDVEVRLGGGAYVCGEETAIFNSIEGYRGEPRNKPPYPTDAGLFGAPTLVHNVETLANVPPILTAGAEAFAATVAGGSTGTKLVCLSGAVSRPGVYEVPFSATLGELVETAGGVPEGRALQALLVGGAAGAFAGPGDLGVAIGAEDLRRAGLTLGSGAVVVFDDRADLGAALARIAEFFREESCGQCVPCRIGTQRQVELVGRLRGVPAHPERDLALVREVGRAMRDASICGLGQTASAAIESAVDRLGALGPRRGREEGS